MVENILGKGENAVTSTVLRMVENILGKGENAITSIFSFSHNVFKRLLFQGRQKSGLCGKDLISCVFSLVMFYVFQTIHAELVSPSTTLRVSLFSRILKIDECHFIIPLSILNFHAPVSKDGGHIVLPLSVCPSVHLSVCLSAQT